MDRWSILENMNYSINNVSVIDKLILFNLCENTESTSDTEVLLVFNRYGRLLFLLA